LSCVLAPVHSPAIIVASVIGGLVAMTILLLVYVKVREVQEKNQHVETADFDFHPELESHSYNQDEEPPVTMKGLVKSAFRRLGGLCANNDSDGARIIASPGTSGQRSHGYGSLENSLYT